MKLHFSQLPLKRLRKLNWRQVSDVELNLLEKDIIPWCSDITTIRKAKIYQTIIHLKSENILIDVIKSTIHTTESYKYFSSIIKPAQERAYNL